MCEITHLVWACYYPRKFVLVLILAFDHGLDDAGMVRSKVDKDMGNARLPACQQSLVLVVLYPHLPKRLEKGKGRSVYPGCRQQMFLNGPRKADILVQCILDRFGSSNSPLSDTNVVKDSIIITAWKTGVGPLRDVLDDGCLLYRMCSVAWCCCPTTPPLLLLTTPLGETGIAASECGKSTFPIYC